MKHFCYYFLIPFISVQIKAQSKLLSNEIMPSRLVQTTFNDSVKKDFKVNFPIFRVYKYTDRSGEYYCILAESRDSIDNEKDTFNHSIKAINLKFESGKFKKLWELNDNIIHNRNEENSIWFWTSYFDFVDFDSDELIEPVIVYGTRAINGYDDGQIKFIIFYKSQKIVIRHQNGVLDNQRETQVDHLFYTLPQKLKDNIKTKMALMEKQGKAIFTETW